ncbi:MAG: DNA-protecting protein DprA [Eubacterium sp.]|nr:DNA-protecting protein DprA [Eubacterium sp.]
MIYKYWLANIQKLNKSTLKDLLEAAGSAETIYRLKRKELLQAARWQEDQLDWFLQYKKSWDLQKEWEKFQKSGMSLVTLEQEEYPARLREIYDAPYGVFYYGSLQVFQGKTAGIVGARKCSEYGKHMAEELAGNLSAAGISVVSGMAEGIDAAAHIGTIKAEGDTAAVLGCGANICYPAKNRKLYDNIRLNGCVLSEFPPGEPPLAWHFPARNRIISALCDILIVVEARERSGSLITADFALEQGKDVYAVPGRATDDLSRGCNELIRQGAGIITGSSSFPEELQTCENLSFGQTSFKLPLEKDEMLLYSCFDLYPKGLEEILFETPFSCTELPELIISLQSKGYIKEVFKNQYIKSK